MAIEKFIAKPENLITAVSWFLIDELNLEEVKSYPPITTLSKADEAKFLQMENQRVTEVSLINEEKLSSKEKMKIFIK